MKLKTRFWNMSSSNVAVMQLERKTLWVSSHKHKHLSLFLRLLVLSNNVSWLLSLRRGHQNKLKVVNPSLHRHLESKICYCFLLDMGLFFLLGERVCSRRHNAHSMLLHSSVPCSSALRLYFNFMILKLENWFPST